MDQNRSFYDSKTAMRIRLSTTYGISNGKRFNLI